MSDQLNITRYPVGYVPIVTFDTSVHNRLANLEAQVLSEIGQTRHVRIGGLSVEEMVATFDPTVRRSLFAHSSLLLDANEDRSDTLVPPSEILRRLIMAHRDNPWTFDWRTVEVRARGYHDEILEPDIIMDESLSSEQREQQRELLDEYKRAFTVHRSMFEDVFAAHDTPRPRTFRQAIAGFESADQKITTSVARSFYARVTGARISRTTAMEFVSVCPPVRAHIYSTLMSLYDLVLRDPHHGERFRAGRNDMAMSVYLPYCDEFVSRDSEQAKCLREIAAVAGVATDVLSLDEFVARIASDARCTV